MNEELLKSIISCYREKKLIPFIGSGFSKPLGLPSWRELVLDVAKKLNYEEDLFLLHGTYPQLLEYIKHNHESEWKTFLHNLRVSFDDTNINIKRKASKAHSVLAGLKNIRTIYTTNYDLQIEKALRDHGRKVNVLSGLADFMGNQSHNADCDIIKFHGSLENDDLILTESEYFRRMNLEEAVDQRLRSDLLSNSFLFIGYSFTDTNIRYIWYKINEFREKLKIHSELRNSYLISFNKEPIQNKLLKRLNISTISLDPEDKEKELSNFLEHLK